MDGTTDDQSDRVKVGRGFAVGAVVVAALVVAALVLLVVPSRDAGGRPGQAAGSSTATASQPPVASSEASDSPCDLPAGDDAVPRTTPADTQWELVGRVVAPAAPGTHGPARDEPVRSCFARTPLGALYAAANVLAVTTLPDGGRILANDLGADGPGRDTALDNLPAAASAPSTGAPFQLAGFSFLSWTEDETVIDLAVLAVADTQSVHAHTPMTLRWEDGDWRLVYSDEGAPFPRVQALPSLAGYVPWSGT